MSESEREAAETMGGGTDRRGAHSGGVQRRTAYCRSKISDRAGREGSRADPHCPLALPFPFCLTRGWNCHFCFDTEVQTKAGCADTIGTVKEVWMMKSRGVDRQRLTFITCFVSRWSQTPAKIRQRLVWRFCTVRFWNLSLSCLESVVLIWVCLAKQPQLRWQKELW